MGFLKRRLLTITREVFPPICILKDSQTTIGKAPAGYEPSGPGLSRQLVGFRASLKRKLVGAALPRGSALARRPTPVTFANGREADICIWWTHIRWVADQSFAFLPITPIRGARYPLAGDRRVQLNERAARA